LIAPLWWRRVRRHFGISAPQMMVRPPLPWWGRSIVIGTLLAVVAGTWWSGFDFGQIFGGWNRTEVQARLASLEPKGRVRRQPCAAGGVRSRARSSTRDAFGHVDAARRPTSG